VTYILGLWVAVLVASTIAAGLGYGLLGSAPALVIAVTQAFAAGAILTMLADTMMPEAFELGGREVGLLTTLGFALAVGIAVWEHVG
jgi:ZIP family zinc transporter